MSQMNRNSNAQRFRSRNGTINSTTVNHASRQQRQNNQPIRSNNIRENYQNEIEFQNYEQYRASNQTNHQNNEVINQNQDYNGDDESVNHSNIATIQNNNRKQVNIRKYNIAALFSSNRKDSNKSKNDSKKQSLLQQILNYVSVVNQEQSSGNDEPSNELQPLRNPDSQPNNEQQKYQWKGSIKYLLQILKLDLNRLIVSFVFLITMTIVQLNYPIDQNCDLKELYEKGQNKHLDSRCPMDSYVLINLRSIIALNCINGMLYMLVMNIFQIKQIRMLRYILLLILMIQMIMSCVYHTANNFKIINEQNIIQFIMMLVLWYLTKHNIGVIMYRFLQVLFYLSMTFLTVVLTVQMITSNGVYLSMILQYTTLIMKKISYSQIENRLKQKLYYDDIAFYLIFIVSLEYAFVFDYLLIQNRPFVYQFLVCINFVIIQAQNITNQNVFYLVYIYFKDHKVTQGIIMFNYAILVIMICSQIVQNALSSLLYILIALTGYLKIAYKFFERDNQLSEHNQLIAISENGYLEQSIAESDIKHFTCQQSIIAYYHFLIYQIMLLIVRLSQAPNPTINGQFQLVYYINKTGGNNLTVLNVIVFNVAIFLVLFGLVVIRSNSNSNSNQLKVVKQITKYQAFGAQLIGCTGVICLFASLLFQDQYTNQSVTLL